MSATKLPPLTPIVERWEARASTLRQKALYATTVGAARLEGDARGLDRAAAEIRDAAAAHDAFAHRIAQIGHQQLIMAHALSDGREHRMLSDAEVLECEVSIRLCRNFARAIAEAFGIDTTEEGAT